MSLHHISISRHYSHYNIRTSVENTERPWICYSWRLHGSL